MINIAIVGYGNLGRGVRSALANSQDMKLVAMFSRRPEATAKEVKDVPVLNSEQFSLPKGLNIDVAILCGGSRQDTPVQGPAFVACFSTVDSFDTHADIPAYYRKLDAIAKQKGNVCVISAGWDPGIFSLERVMGDARGYTFWGPGVSQGHSDAARKVKGVLDARQYTMPVEGALKQVRGGKTPEFTKSEMHLRVVYAVAEDGTDKARITKEIADMPNYYNEYNTEVHFISKAEMAKNHSVYPHGGFVLTTGVTGKGNREILEYSCQLKSNPEFTGSVLAACARAACRLKATGNKGAFTMLDIPPALFSPRTPEELREHFM